MIKQFTYLFVAVLSMLSLQVYSQTELYSENFNGATNTFTLNTSEVGSGAVENIWIVNNAYAGGDITGTCDQGFPLPLVQPVPTTPDQPGGIVGGPQSKYLHIVSDMGISVGIINSSVLFSVPLCIPPGYSFTKMTNGVSTVGEPSINFSFWWLCGGGPNTFGEAYYSINGGVSWILVPGSPPQFKDALNWNFVSYTDPVFGNQPDLRFAFRFVNEDVNGVEPSLLSFAIDDIKITANQPTSETITTGGVLAGPYCPGDEITIPYSASGTFSPGNIFTAQISNNLGNFGSPIEIGSVSGTGTGVITGIIPSSSTPGSGYLIRVISSNPAVIGTPSTISVIVSDGPQPTIASSSTTSVCVNGVATLNYGGTPGNVQWYSSTDGVTFSAITGATNNTYTSGPLTTAMFYKVEVVTACGTSSSPAWQVSLGSSVNIPLTTSPNSLNLCNGPVTVSVVGTFTGLNWTTGETGNTSIIVSEPGTVSVTGSDPNGCPAESDELTFVGTGALPLNVTPQNPVTFCGTPLTLAADPGFASYLWSTGETTAAITINALPQTPLSVSAIDNNGCQTAPAEVVVVEGSSVNLPVSPSLAAVCSGQPAVLTADPGYLNYLWSNGATTSTISVATVGYYSVTATDPNGCLASSPMVQVIQSQFPVPNFTYSQNSGYTIAFNNTSQNGISYEWAFDSLSTSPLNNPTYTFPAAGAYFVNLIATNPCGTDTIKKLVIVAQVGINEMMLEHSIKVFPNPSHGDFTLSLSSNQMKTFSYSLMDMTGRIVFSERKEITGEQLLTIPAENLRSGVYFLTIKEGNRSTFLKLVKAGY